MRLDFQSEKAVLPYMKMNFDNAYRTDSMYKISTIVPNSVINDISTSTYFSTLWHNRLGHINYMKIFNMKMLGLLPNYRGDKPEKYEVCLQVMFTLKPFSNITRSTNLLDLIHSDTCDF